MAESIRAPDAPPSAPSLAGAALTTGAAVLTGLLLGRKGMAGLAAGVAAMAGAKWLSDATRKEEISPVDAGSTRTDPMAEVPPPMLECPDWVDHDAVLFNHAVPDATAAMEMLQEKSLPLLDDNGLPVDEVTVLPAYPATPVYDFPFGPIIWQAGWAVQSRSDSAGETVWFGMQDVTPWMQLNGPPTPALLPAAQSVDPMPRDAKSVSETTLPHVQEKTVHVPHVQLIENAFGAAEAQGDETAQGEAPFNHAAAASAPDPFSTAAEVMRSPAASGHAPIITPRTTAKPVLPQPRQTGVAPKPLAERDPHDNNEELAGKGTDLSTEQGHRHLEPIAPSGEPHRERRWPLVLLLSFLTAILVLVIADRLHEGALLRKAAARSSPAIGVNGVGAARSEK